MRDKKTDAYFIMMSSFIKQNNHKKKANYEQKVGLPCENKAYIHTYSKLRKRATHTFISHVCIIT